MFNAGEPENLGTRLAKSYTYVPPRDTLLKLTSWSSTFEGSGNTSFSIVAVDL